METALLDYTKDTEIYLSGGSGGAVIVIGNDLIGNSVGSLSNTSVARQVVTNNLCSTGTC